MIKRLEQYQLDEVERMIELLNKRAMKLSQPLINVKVSNVQVEIIAGINVQKFDVELDGICPQVRGWRFVAALDHNYSETGEMQNVVKNITSDEVPETYRTAMPNCDHCNKTRNRLVTYILRNDQDEYMQVGSSCIKDFSGIDLNGYLEAISQLIEFIGEAEESDPEEFSFAGGSSHYLIDTKTFIAYTIRMINEHGWMSISKAVSMGHASLATSERALDQIIQSSKERNFVTEEELATAVKTIEQVKSALASQSRLSEYEWNLRTVANRSGLTLKDCGIAASMVQWLNGYVERNTPKPENGKHLGKIGDKIEVVVTIDSERMFSGVYGITYLYKMHDQENNVVVWFSSNRLFDAGAVVTLKATVKDHSVFNGVSQTVITRAKVQKEQ